MKRILTAVALLHLIGWGLLIWLGAETVTIGTGLLAYTLGLRHAFDADHLVAIDTTTRKLIHEHKEAHGVGFFFSLGHSTVVFTATVLAIFGISTIGTELLDETSPLKQAGGFIGGLIAGTFLILLALYNMYILYRIFKHDDAQPSGFWSRFMKPVSSPAQMYPIGLLFGLGFDTATSIAMLSLSIIGVASGQVLFAAISLPIIFTSGMALGDTISGYIMQRSFQWATKTDKRRTYNITLTALAIIAALAIGIPILMEL